MADQVTLSLSLRVGKAMVHATVVFGQFTTEQDLLSAASDLVHDLVVNIGRTADSRISVNPSQAHDHVAAN